MIFFWHQAKENTAGLEVDAEKDLRYKLIQKFKRMQQEELIKEKVRLKALATDGSTTLKKPADSTGLSLSSNSGDETDTKARLGNDEGENIFYTILCPKYGLEYWKPVPQSIANITTDKPSKALR